MEQEYINELNKVIIDQYSERISDLEIKITALKKTYDEGKLADEELAGLKEIIEAMEVVKDKIVSQRTRMQRKADNGISLLQNNKRVLSNQRYQRSYDKVASLNEKITSKIDMLQGITDDISSSNKAIQNIKNKLEIRIQKLKEKQGKIKNKQMKIVDKAINSKLDGYMKKIRRIDKMSERLVKKDEKIHATQEKIDLLSTEKEQIASLRDQLMTGDFSEKKLANKLLLREKMTSVRILSLKRKKGVLNKSSNHAILKEVNPSLIEKMKKKVSMFKETVSSSLKKGMDSVQEYYDSIAVPAKAR